MKKIKLKIEDLEEDLVLAEDLYVERRMLMRSGSILTNRLINLLKNRNIQHVHVFKTVTKSNVIENAQCETNVIENARCETNIIENARCKTNVIENARCETNVIENTQCETNEPLKYLEVLAELSTELRYGHALKNIEDIYSIQYLFNSFIKNDNYKNYLLALKERDLYSFKHAIDVFTLATLFAKKEGIKNLERISLGFLLHDIGKLKTPIDILKKQGKLTKTEFAVMQRHTIDGYEMFCELGLQDLAYLAKSHHECLDGSGYPEGLMQQHISKEVQILHLIDIYSAITLKRPYKAEVGAAEAISFIYKDKRLFDEELLARFVEFIGIYPENAVVLLSNGYHAIVEKTTSLFPLLPTVRLFNTGESFTLPMDFQLTIQKILSYNVETPSQLFIKFSDYLINGDFVNMVSYYNKLKDHYRPFEWFTHIYIPVFQIFNILKTNMSMAEMKIGVQLTNILFQTIVQLRILNKRKSNVLLIVDEQLVPPVTIQIFEGLLHTEEIYPFILSRDVSEEELQSKINCCNIESIYMIGRRYEGEIQHQNIYHLSKQQLETFLYRLACVNLTTQDLNSKLKKYRVKNMLVMH